jgi:hypothetical protein
MSAESVSVARPGARVQADQPSLALALALERIPSWFWAGAAWTLLAAVFVLLGGGNLDVNETEARLGIAAGEPLGPVGRVSGGWDPSVWPAPVVLSQVWAWGEEGTPTAASVRWPSAIAAILIGLLLARRLMTTLDLRTGVLVGLTWFGSLAMIDRSAEAGLDLITGLATVGAIDRLLSGRASWGAGIWGALAFLAAGWPPLVLLGLATVLFAHRDAIRPIGLLLPPLAVIAIWSIWALSVAPGVWGPALVWPLKQPMHPWMTAQVLALGLPWCPLAVLALSRSVRGGWPEMGRGVVLGWLQVAGVSLLVGTVVPGMALSARVPALAGLAVASAACANRLGTGALSTSARRSGLAVAALIVALWVALIVVGGIYVASAVSYYRGVAIALMVSALPTALFGLVSVFKGDARRSLLALAAVAIGLKIAHYGYHVPEWNYRFSQGPWGRAIGQWVVPRWPIYCLNAWPADLAFATGHPFRPLAHPRVLGFDHSNRTKYILMLTADFENWPGDAPPIVPVHTFQDQRGQERVLVRTGGAFSWKSIQQSRRDDE